MTKSKSFAVLLTVALALAAGGWAKKKPKAAPPPAKYDYFLLSLSWAPEYCKTHPTDKTAECKKGNKMGFVVHGLWPQDETSQGPTCKADGQKITAAIATAMANYMPTKDLMQHEWDNHGSCSGLTMTDYFAAIRKTRDSVTIPAALKAPASQSNMTEAQIESAFASANPSDPATAFRVTCPAKDLQEVHVCFTKAFAARACGSSAGQCSGSAIVLPVK